MKEKITDMKYRIFSLLMGWVMLIGLSSCHNEIENVSSGLNGYYYVERMHKLLLSPGYEGKSYQWLLRLPDGRDSLLATSHDYVFLAEKEGTYSLSFRLDDGERGFRHDFPVTVVHEDTEYSPYTAKVYEYRPAPGQFVNTMPLYENGDNEETMRQKAEDDLVNDVMITLGAYGGYVTFGFDHTVVNVPGQKDFFIKGNAFYSDIPDYASRKGGSAEPGIVMVAFDRNCNGVPDEDEWYELAGSEYHNPKTVKNYEITYTRPSVHAPVPNPQGTLTDTLYIPWTDNQGTQGYFPKNRFHTQSYYPEWLHDDKLIFRGSLLPPNGVDESHVESYYVLYAYPWGYVDNHPNEEKNLCSFDISWAVDKEGNPVHLPGVDFVRVYTGVRQNCGWIGETSTEVARAQDLHIENEK